MGIRSSSVWRRGGVVNSEIGALSVLLAAVAVVVLLAHVLGPGAAPSSLVALPVMAGGLLLGRRRHMVLLLAVAAGTMSALLVADGPGAVRPASAIVVAAVGALSLVFVSNRERLGVSTLRGDTMLLELQQQLRRQGDLPPLPPGWHAEIELRSAGGVGFGGDFLVASVGRDALELVLVDVSGKGVDAGTRALLLSGALGGLLGEVDAERFLPAANRYLLRQRWPEGFATAVHVAVNLVTGDYRLDCAGHPPAGQFAAGTGIWQLVGGDGPVLGVLEGESWPAVTGRLRPGDALLLYTDGLVEEPGRDLGLGIDRLLGHANRLVISSFDGGAAKLVDAVAPSATDDRALVLLWRSA